MSTHLPFRALRPLHRQCIFQHPASVSRSFSTTLARQRKAKSATMTDPVQIEASFEYGGGRAPDTEREQAMSEADSVPDDLGLISGTLVRAAPFSGQLPSLLSWDRVRFEWKFLNFYLTNWYSLYKYRTTKRQKPYPNVDFWSHSQLKSQAIARYRDVYDAFARGDPKTISKVCLDPLARQFQGRLASRPHGMKINWRISKVISTKVISNRGVTLPLPNLPESASRQVIVRVKTQQVKEVQWGKSIGVRKKSRGNRLAWTPDGFQPENKEDQVVGEVLTRAEPKVENITEYMVLQKRMFHGVEESEWRIQGFLEPSTLESIAKTEEQEAKMAAHQASSPV